MAEAEQPPVEVLHAALRQLRRQVRATRGELRPVRALAERAKQALARLAILTADRRAAGAWRRERAG